MRTDVKLGVVISMVVVLTVGGYFLFSGPSEPPIPVGDRAATATDPAAKPGAAKPAAAPNNRSRQVNSSKDAAPRTSLPVAPAGRDAPVASKPASPPVSPSSSPPVPDRVVSALPGTLTKPTVERRVDPQPASHTLTNPAENRADTASPSSTGLSTPAPGSDPVASTDPSNLNRAPSSPAASPASTDSLTAMVSKNLPTATSTPPDSASKKGDFRAAAADTHKVQPGDSLASLSQAYYGNAKYAKFLADSNTQVADPARLALGVTIKIPPLPSDVDMRIAGPTKTASTATANASGRRTYKVQAGDSFYRIARDQLGNANRWKELLALNKTLVHNDPTQLQVGQTLLLPES